MVNRSVEELYAVLTANGIDLDGPYLEAAVCEALEELGWEVKAEGAEYDGYCWIIGPCGDSVDRARIIGDDTWPKSASLRALEYVLDLQQSAENA